MPLAYFLLLLFFWYWLELPIQDWIKVVECGRPCLIAELKRKVFSIRYDVDYRLFFFFFNICPLSSWGNPLLFFIYSGFQEWVLNFVKLTFCVSWDDCMVFLYLPIWWIALTSVFLVLFILNNFWLCCVFIVAQALIVVSRDFSRCGGFPCCRAEPLGRVGFCCGLGAQ